MEGPCTDRLVEALAARRGELGSERCRAHLSRGLEQLRERYGTEADPESLSTLLAEKLSSSLDEASLLLLQVHELGLVDGCLRRERVALTAFEKRVLLPTAASMSARLLNGLERDELCQRAMEKLLVSDAPRLRSYGGRGPLSAWLRAVLTRIALDARSEVGPDAREDAELADVISALPADGNPELDALRASHGKALATALRQVMQRLPRRERTVLRLHLFQGLSTEQLGRVFHAHPATVRRWIQGARESVLDGVRRELSERLLLTPSRVDSFVRGFDSRIELSLGGLNSVEKK